MVTVGSRDQRLLPGFYVTSLLHKCTQGEPKAIEDGEIVRNRRSIGVVLDVPFKRTEAADKEEHNTDANVGKDDTHPDLVR